MITNFFKTNYKYIINFILMLVIIQFFTISTIAPSNNITSDTVYNSSSIQVVSNTTSSDEYNQTAPSGLYAKYAALIDGNNCRVLFEKDGFTPAANASTTKIMTLIIALEYGNLDDIITVSGYAASMPDVQLNIQKGEHYALRDLLYSLMLKSHNDSAVAIAENIALKYLQDNFNSLSEEVKESIIQAGLIVSSNSTNTSVSNNIDTSTPNIICDFAQISTEQSKYLVSVFAKLMNDKALSLGCTSTHFITPNGLDASDETGPHSITAVDLAKIMAYCIQNKTFLEITSTSTYSSSSGSRPFTVSNANAFLNMMDGVISGKTGFTGDAGYCYVCALQRDDKIYVSVVLASGWPNNKTYKWHDTKALMNFGIQNYFSTNIFSPIDNYKNVPVKNGIQNEIATEINGNVSMLLSRFDNVNIVYELPELVSAPIEIGEKVGSANIYINESLYCTVPITSKNKVDKIQYFYCLTEIFKKLFIVSLN